MPLSLRARLRRQLTTDVSEATTLGFPPARSSVSGRGLAIIGGAWALITAVVLGLVITAVPHRFQAVMTSDPNLRAPEFRNLIDVGMSAPLAASLDITASVLLVVATFVGGVVIFVRGWGAREAIFASLTVILYGASFSGLMAMHRVAGAPFSQPLAGLLATALYFLQSSTTFMAEFWLPQGRFVYRPVAWLIAALVIFNGYVYFGVGYPRSHDLVNMVGLPVVVLCIVAQSIHYHQVENAVTRQQIKWVVMGILIAAFGFFTSQMATVTIGARSDVISAAVMLVARVTEQVCGIALPVCIAVAVLRHGLWQVDLVINRSVVYGALATTLMVVLVGGGFGLQQLVGGDHADIAFAGSTIAAALLFQPARHVAQRFVDRRLYGFRFDLNELTRAQRSLEVKTPGAYTGRTVGGYRILGVLGVGGMGEVYEAERHGGRFAIKLVPRGRSEPLILRSFDRESESLAAIHHPNIVRFYEAGEVDGLRYIVLDLVDGCELTTVIRTRVRLPLDEARTVVRDIAAALDYAHSLRLVHRDIKPSNIMVRTAGWGWQAVLMDFGIAKIADDRTLLTTSGAIGTINYMAPEQIVAAKTVDHRADIYALGIVVYEMVTGERPFTGSPAQVLFAHLHQVPADPRQHVPELPGDAAHALLRALAKNPDERFQSAGELADALGAAPAAKQDLL